MESAVLSEEEGGLELDDHQSGSDYGQPFPRARTHNRSGWGRIRSHSMMFAAQLRQTTVAMQRQLDSQHVFLTGFDCYSTWLVLAVIAVLPSSSVRRLGRRRLLPLSSVTSSPPVATVFRDVIAIGHCHLL